MTPDETSRRVNFPEEDKSTVDRAVLSELRQKLKSHSVNRNGRMSNRNAKALKMDTFMS